MISVVAAKAQEFSRHLGNMVWRRRRVRAAWRKQAERRAAHRLVKKLTANLAPQNLGDERRNSVAEHFLQVGPAAVEGKTVRQCLKTGHFARCELAVAPVKRAGGGAGLRLDRP